MTSEPDLNVIVEQIGKLEIEPDRRGINPNKEELSDLESSSLSLDGKTSLLSDSSLAPRGPTRKNRQSVQSTPYRVSQTRSKGSLSIADEIIDMQEQYSNAHPRGNLLPDTQSDINPWSYMSQHNQTSKNTGTENEDVSFIDELLFPTHTFEGINSSPSPSFTPSPEINCFSEKTCPTMSFAFGQDFNFGDGSDDLKLIDELINEDFVSKAQSGVTSDSDLHPYVEYLQRDDIRLQQKSNLTNAEGKNQEESFFEKPDNIPLLLSPTPAIYQNVNVGNMLNQNSQLEICPPFSSTFNTNVTSTQIDSTRFGSDLQKKAQKDSSWAQGCFAAHMGTPVLKQTSFNSDICPKLPMQETHYNIPSSINEISRGNTVTSFHDLMQCGNQSAVSSTTQPSPVNSQPVQQNIQSYPIALNRLDIQPIQQNQPRIQLSHYTHNQPIRPILPKPLQSENANKTQRLQSTPKHSPVARDKRAPSTRSVGKNKQKEDKARRDISKLTETQLQTPDPEKGDTIVHEYACRGPHENYHLQALLERLKQKNMINIMINSKNKKNQTALYCAVSLNYDKVIKTLVKFGADPNIKAQNGDEQSAPIHIAACSGTTKTIDALLEASDIDIDSINSYGQTALHCAIVQQCVAQNEDGSRKVAMEKLLQKRANHTLQDTKGRTPLIYCVLQKQKDLLTTLVNHIEPAVRKTAIRMKDHFGKSAWDYAEDMKGSDEMFYSNYLSSFQE